MDTLAVDIGTVSVKYVRWKGRGATGKVISKGTYPYQGEPNDLRVILGDIRAKEGTNYNVSVGLTSQDIVKRTFTVPILPKDEMGEALEWSASKVAPSPLEEMVYDYVVLGDVMDRDVKKTEALFVGAAKQFIQALASLFQAAGFERLVCLTDTAFTYGPMMDKGGENSAAIIDIGGRQTSVYIYSGRKLMFARELMTASESFTDALMAGLNFSYEEAESFEQEKGFTDESQPILMVPFERLTGEMHRTFSVFDQRYPEKPISRIYLTGRGSKVPNIEKMIQQVFGEEVSRFTSFPDVGDEYLPSYSLATYRDSFVNLLPPELKQRERRDSLNKWARVATLAVCAVLLVLSMDIWNGLNKRNLDLGVERGALLVKTGQLERLRGQTVGEPQFAEVLAATGALSRKDLTFVTLLKFLSSKLSKDAYLSEIIFDRYTKLEMEQKEREETPRSMTSVRDLVTGAVKETVGIKQPEKESTAVPPKKESEKERNDYLVTLKGYIFGEPEVAEPVFLSVIVRLEGSGFLRDIRIAGKQTIEIQGRKAVQFRLQMRCPAYET